MLEKETLQKLCWHFCKGGHFLLERGGGEGKELQCILQGESELRFAATWDLYFK